jgi:aldose 1-epimerase
MNSFSKIKVDYLVILITSVILMNSCQNKSIKSGLTAENTPAITRENFGDSISGKPIYLYTLKNTNGVVIKITNYGGTITSIIAPDKNGMMGDIVLGFDSLQPYVDGCPYFGSIIGRYGNRINKGKFSLDGKEYELTINNGKNHLHGGKIGFDKVVWESEIIDKDSIDILKLTYYSKDGEEGYPGNLSATVYYSLNNYNELVIEYETETDRTTIVNLTNHSYFNLAGKGSILDQKLKIAANNYTPVDTNLIPTGEIANVNGTPFDFTIQHTIGERIGQVPGGYDHNFILTRTSSDIEWCASLEDTTSGRKLDVYSTEPGLQFYSGNFLNSNITGKYGQVYNKYAALCLETQHFPDSPNNPAFPSTVLKPGEKYHTKTIYRFSIINH